MVKCRVIQPSVKSDCGFDPKSGQNVLLRQPCDGRAGGAGIAGAAAGRVSGGLGVGTPRHPPRQPARLTVRHGRRLHVARCPIWQPYMRPSIPDRDICCRAT